MKFGLVALATFAFAATTASAVSASTVDNPLARDAATLNLKGLDLTTADGQQRLAIRMDQAARAVCGERLSGVHLSLEAKAQECRVAVIADVRSQIEARTARADTAATRVAYSR